MPAADKDLEAPALDPSGYSELPFPPLKKQHVLHCSVHYWYPKYRALTPKSRLIPLNAAFVEYLKADGIVLPPDGSDVDDEEVEFESEIPNRHVRDDEDSSSDEEEEDVERDVDPSLAWQDVHSAVKQAISDFGGKVVPKLNWSAPKDATWINPTNSMECRSANDIYLMLKSSDFITHDLEHWDDDCEFDEDEEDDGKGHEENVRGTIPPYVLFLRKFVQVNPSVEFRVFVRARTIIGITQRDVNHFEFLYPMIPSLQLLIQDFFDGKLRDTFPDENFVFDVYVPAPHKRVWLIDINPWAVRTDPLLFSWLELLTMEAPGRGIEGSEESSREMEEAFQTLERTQNGHDHEGVGFVRLPFRLRDNMSLPSGDGDRTSEDVRDVEEVFIPEFRLIKRDDPEAYSFNTPQYSAHKLPRDVVEASQSGPGPLREFADQWKEMLAREEKR